MTGLCGSKIGNNTSGMSDISNVAYYVSYDVFFLPDLQVVLRIPMEDTTRV